MEIFIGQDRQIIVNADVDAKIINPFKCYLLNPNRLTAGGDLFNLPIDRDPTNGLFPAIYYTDV